MHNKQHSTATELRELKKQCQHDRSKRIRKPTGTSERFKIIAFIKGHITAYGYGPA
jgi:hypothetical protein